MFNRLLAFSLAAVATIVCATPTKADTVVDEQPEVDYFDTSSVLLQPQRRGFELPAPPKTNAPTYKDILNQWVLDAENELLRRGDPAQTAIDENTLTQTHFPTVYDTTAARADEFTRGALSRLGAAVNNYNNSLQAPASSTSKAFSRSLSDNWNVDDSWEDDSHHLQCYVMERGMQCE